MFINIAVVKMPNSTWLFTYLHVYNIHSWTCTYILNKHLTVALLRSSLRMELDLVNEINIISQLLSNHRNDIFAAIQCQLLSTDLFLKQQSVQTLLLLSSPSLAVPLSSRKTPEQQRINLIFNIDDLCLNGTCTNREK